MPDLDHIPITSTVLDRTALKGAPRTSVIVLTYHFAGRLLKPMLLKLLNEQTGPADYEVILVDNNETLDITSFVTDLPLRYIKTEKNSGVSIGRNIGAQHARGDILIFIDDDAVPHQDFIVSHLNAYANPYIFGVRGRSFPKNKTTLNRFATHYDLGTAQKPFTINTEFNCSFRKAIFQEAGGFLHNPVMYHEGIDLSCRISRHYQAFDHLVYDPNPIVYHNYAENFSEFVKKKFYNEFNYRFLYQTYPDCVAYMDKFKSGQSPAAEPLTRWTQLKMKCLDHLATGLAKRELKKATV